MNAYKSLSNTLLHFSAERFFAPPSLNDLYWPVLGNENLLSELGYAFKLNVSNNRSSNSKFYYKTGLFYNVVDNWIVWAPDEFAIFRGEMMMGEVSGYV